MPSKEPSPEPPSYEAQCEEEAHLPLNGGFEHEQMDQDALPKDHASPNEVRQFISHVLVSKRQLPVDHARRVAARWTVGSGLELRTYSASMYFELFGTEDGWILYREVAMISHADWRKKGINRHAPDISLAISSVVFIALIIVVFLTNDRVWTSVAFIGIFISGLVVMGAFAARFVGPKSEDTITMELKHAAEKVESRNK
ncbi:hypothetical protein D0868_03233 [Hortaea werneckii]|uniref:Uncharacterized protein n=1 Tax=Hortaea werneckii TaxID=91943 RepID=A0A3M6Z851_HORWE|nr:hypothetical protein D0868_03233 [Hortaea werneckii]